MNAVLGGIPSLRSRPQVPPGPVWMQERGFISLLEPCDVPASCSSVARLGCFFPVPGLCAHRGTTCNALPFPTLAAALQQGPVASKLPAVPLLALLTQGSAEKPSQRNDLI